MAMAISLSDQQSQPKPKPSSQTQPPRTSAPVQATDDLPMYRDIPSAPTYEPLPEPEYTNPQVSGVKLVGLYYDASKLYILIGN